MPRLTYAGSLLLFSAVACLAPVAARAVPITSYVTVQPIDVCSGAAGTTIGCAPINNKGQTYANAPVGAVGSLDATTGINITDAIWAQAGISVTFLPAAQDPNAGSFQTIQITSCAADGTDCMSPQFQTLSDQASISLRQPPSPAPPLSANPTTLNMFFVTKLSPPTNQPGVLYGLSWINNNGIAIASNALVGLGARVDTLAHEIGHTLDLDHATFGAGAANNLLTAGNLRTEPTSTSNALAQLAAGTADQLLAAQEAQVLLSGFVSPIANVVTQISDPKGGGDFSVAFANAGRENESLTTLILTTPTGTYLEDDSFRAEGGTDGITATPSFSSCSSFGKTQACQVLTLTFAGTPFQLGNNFNYTVGVCTPAKDGWKSACKTVPLADLVGDLQNGTYTYQFDDGYQTTSVLTGDTVLSADSWDPDPTIPSEIYNQALLLAANMDQPPCTPTDGSCPALQLEDGSPLEEGGQPVPEPPSAPIVLAAIGATLLFRRRVKLRGIAARAVSM
jgi:hypothetical protein